MDKITLFIWVVDSLLKVFPTTMPPSELQTTVQMACACNEWESAQIAVRSSQAIQQLQITASDLKQTGGSGSIPAGNVLCRFVGFIPIEKNTPNTPDDQLVCKAPEKIPDVLLEDTAIAVPADFTQPVWITILVPTGIPAGEYRGELEIQADQQRTTLPLQLTVYDFTLPEDRDLFVTNWFDTGNIAKAHQVELWSDAFFSILSAYARDMAEHRQNVFWVSPWLTKTTRQSNGVLSFDYALFDRYVQTFLDAGVQDRIEIMHVAHPGKEGWESKEVTLQDITVKDETGQPVVLPPDDGLGPFLAALQDHLEQKGWLDRAMIHICDEPSVHNLDAWKAASRFVHHYAPRIKRIDAIETTEFDGFLEVWVPKLNHLRNWFPYYDRARAAGNELWYYICLHPQGSWLNRFLDYPLLDVRLLHWLNFRYDISGYLHWGLNFWGDDPFGTPRGDLPPGDSHVIYPGKQGPLDSIRWETQRDSLEDYEYLCLLETLQSQAMQQLGKLPEEFDPHTRSSEYCCKIVRTFNEFEQDVTRFRTIQENLAREIEQTMQEPVTLVTTLPWEDIPLIPGPIAVEVYGATRPGAKITMNGTEIPVSEDGVFHTQARNWGKNDSITIDVEWNGKKKQIVRTFTVEEE